MKQDLRYAALKHVSRDDFRRDGVALLREAETSPIVVVSEDGSPRMIVSCPTFTDDELLGRD